MQINFALLLCVGLMGGAGAVLRFLLANIQGWLPWGTLLANTLASMLGAIALLYFGAVHQDFFEVTMVAGFAGGLSTLSTLAGQLHTMFKDRQVFKALVYALASFVIPSTAVVLVTMFR